MPNAAAAMHPLEPVLSNESASSLVEVGDYEFCFHGRESCKECGTDYREDNSFTAGVDPCETRDAIEIDLIMKDGEPTCKKHKNANCSTCYGSFKKQIVKLTKDGNKRAKAEAKAHPKSNLLV
ncbi:hypothetical protein JCM8097_002249 [Rhodosporidiobolus ruineniae]